MYTKEITKKLQAHLHSCYIETLHFFRLQHSLQEGTQNVTFLSNECTTPKSIETRLDIPDSCNPSKQSSTKHSGNCFSQQPATWCKPRRFHFFKSRYLIAYSDHCQAWRAALSTASKSRNKNHAFSHNMVSTIWTSTNDPCRSTMLAPSDIQKFHQQLRLLPPSNHHIY